MKQSELVASLREHVMSLPLSVYYITLNEELRLPESLAKVVGWVDEIVVVDSGSSDRTREIAQAAGARFVHNDWQGFAWQKSHAESLCKNDWVLNLDADEVLSDEAVASLKKTFSSAIAEQTAGFSFRWVIHPPVSGHPFRHDKHHFLLRCYHRKRAGFTAEEHSIHDRPESYGGKIIRLKGDVYHMTLLSLEQLERKYSKMSSDQALHLVAKGRQISNLRLFSEFPLKFLRYYLLHRQILNGWFGLSVAITAANRNFMRLAKAKELQMLAALDQERDKTHASE